jgi:HD-GYP domain-containing protein (c-di-GMP phosphodiesterase class II)
MSAPMVSGKKHFYTLPSFVFQGIVNIMGIFLILKYSGEWTTRYLLIYFIWTLFSIATELNPITMPTKDQLTVSFAIHVSAMILFGIATAILISALSNVIVDIIGRRGLQKVLFNASQYTITIYASWVAYSLLSPNVELFTLKHNFMAMIASCLTYVIVNYFLVSTIVSLSQGNKLYRMLTMDVKLELLHFASLVPVSLLIVELYKIEPYSITIVFLPLAVAHFSFDNYITLRTETQKTIEALADTIDKRDSYTFEHSRRVASYCSEIAKIIKLHPDESEHIISAAKVHDLGKISVPDTILLKKGKLNSDEYSTMINHSLVGYTILNNLKFYKYGAKVVLHHHEKYDGSGYPHGLKGDGIPLGARILAVADSYDAMTTNRPYKDAMSREEAIGELLRCSGSQFDPIIVEAFIKILQGDKNYIIPGGG